MADLIGIQIKDLTTAGSISDTTELPVQRNGITKAEKINLSNVTNYIISSTPFITNINTNVNSKILTHVNANDPHGDRAYTNSAVSNHISSTDPHGDRAFATNIVNTSVNTHISASDPHGDRAFATASINTHTNATDPHGDRAFASAQISTAISNHTNAVDPHGDRAYTTTSITNHVNAVDPHGDRAFATNAANGAVTTSNSYTDNKINSEFTNRITTTIAPLVSGKVPDIYINKELVFSNYSGFPVTGSSNILYIDSSGDDIYRWNGTAYINLTPAVDIGSLTLTTNDVAPGSNLDRQYLTQAKEAIFNSKLSNVASEPASTSVSLYSRKDNPTNTAYIKTLDTYEPLKVQDTGTIVVIGDNNYKYIAEGTTSTLDLSLRESTRTDELSGYSDDSIYRIKGEIFGYTTASASGQTIVSNSNTINIDARISMLGVTQAVPPVTTAIVNSAGTQITGTGLTNSTLEVYSKTYALLGTTPINAIGNYTYNISPTNITGDPLYLYVKTPTNERSNRTTVYTPNKTALRPVTSLSVTPDGTIIRGLTERLVTVNITNSSDVNIGTGTSDTKGYFEITLTTAVVDLDEINVDTINSYGIEGGDELEVSLSSVISPYYIEINNSRTTISGKAQPNGTVTVYNASMSLLNSYTVDGSGNFSGNLSASASELDDFILRCEESSNTSTDVYHTLTTKLVMNNAPTVIPILIDSEFNFIYKDIVKRNNSSPIDFDIIIDTVNEDIILRGINGTGVNTKWIGDIKIDVEDI